MSQVGLGSRARETVGTFFTTILVSLIGLSVLPIRSNGDEPIFPPGQQLLPSLVMEGVGLRDAIASLARQCELNVILDPRIASMQPVPTVTRRWENISPERALRIILREHQLILVTNAMTTVARIAPGGVAVRPIAAGTMGLGGADTAEDEIVPLIVIDGVPLIDTIKNIARQAGLKLYLEPAFVNAAQSDFEVSVRWENLTARQGLVAVVDNYGLTIEPGKAPKTAVIRIRPPK